MARGMCEAHWARWKRGRDSDEPIGLLPPRPKRPISRERQKLIARCEAEADIRPFAGVDRREATTWR